MTVQEHTKTVPVNGTVLHYIEAGSGDPVIFVHGSQGDYRSWGPQMDAFSHKYHAIAYSRRYHYPNAWTGSGQDYTVHLHAADLIGLIEALGVAPANVVGNSFGAYTTLVAAAQRPELMRKIVIGEPPILVWLKSLPGGQAIWDDFMQTTWNPATQAFQNGDLEQGLRAFVEGVSGRKGAFDQMPEGPRRRALDNARELAAETASPGYYTVIPPETFARLPMPVLLLKGERSPEMFHRIIDRLAEVLPGAQQATIPNASHSMASGNPEEYNRVVMGFLR